MAQNVNGTLFNPVMISFNNNFLCMHKRGGLIIKSTISLLLLLNRTLLMSPILKYVFTWCAFSFFNKIQRLKVINRIEVFVVTTSSWEISFGAFLVNLFLLITSGFVRSSSLLALAKANIINKV